MSGGPVIFIPTYGGSASGGGSSSPITKLSALTSDGLVQTSGGDGTLSVTTAPSIASLTLSSLTSGRVPFATTAGLLTDDADLTFATDTLSFTKGIITTSLGIGTGATAPATKLHVADTSATSPRGLMSSQHSDDTGSAHLHMRKSRGTMASPTIVVTGDILGRAVFSGYDGASYLEMGSIRCTSTGTIASTRVPTTMEFMTATDAAPSVLTSRMSIAANGTVAMTANITSSSTVTGTLVVTGGIGATNNIYGAGGVFGAVSTAYVTVGNNGATTAVTYTRSSSNTYTGLVAAGGILSGSADNDFIFNNRAGPIVLSADSGFTRLDAVITTAGNLVLGSKTETGLTGAAGLRVTSATEATTGGAGSVIALGGIYATKKIISGDSVTTGAPTTGTAAAWKLGTVVTGQIGLTVVATQYIQLDVAGTLYRLATV